MLIYNGNGATQFGCGVGMYKSARKKKQSTNRKKTVKRERLHQKT